MICKKKSITTTETYYILHSIEISAYMNRGTSLITYATRIRALLASAGLMSPSPAHVHNWEKSRFRRNVFEGRSRLGEVCCSEVDVRAQQVRSRLSLSLSLALAPVFLFLDAFAIGFDNARLSTARQREAAVAAARRPALVRRSRSVDLRNTPETRASSRLASRRGALTRSHARSCTDLENGRNESAGSQTTFLRLRRTARQVFAPERMREKESGRTEREVSSLTRYVVMLKCD